MKTIVACLLVMIILGTSSQSFAQYTVVDSETIVPEVMLQLELRDSNDNFISYIEAKQVIVIYHEELNEFLDNQSYKKIFIKDDKAYEKIQWQGKTEKIDKEHAYSQFNLWMQDHDELKAILTVRHHSYQSQPGDTLTVYWTVIRPAN